MPANPASPTAPDDTPESPSEKTATPTPEHIRDIATVEDPASLTSEAVITGTAWFLGNEDPDEVAWEEFDLNVSGDPNKPKWVRFKIESIDRDILQQINKDSIDKDTGIEDAVLSNEFTAIQGLVSPDLGDEAQWHGQASARDALRYMFRAKGLLVDLIASRVINLSGGAAKDMREVADAKVMAKNKAEIGAAAATEVAAAGN